MTDRLAQFPAETKEDGDEEEMRTALAAAKDLATDEKKTLSQHHVPIYTTFRITLVFIHCYSPLKKSRVNVLVGLRCSFYSFDNENLKQPGDNTFTVLLPPNYILECFFSFF